jgi:1-deoxy-D-xylulose-5-phosphate synthase
MGGAGSAVLEALQAMQKNISQPVKTLCLGLPDQFIEHGVHETMLADCGLDPKGIADAIAQLIT